MKILIVGDSFSADWTPKYNLYLGWPNLLAEKYDITNLAQAGVSEYKIYKQLETQICLGNYDYIIVAHTSPYRVPTRKHPLLYNDVLHNNADLMANDILYHSSKIKNYFNKQLKAAEWFFKYHYDPDFFTTTYNLYRQAINIRLANYNYISLDFFQDSNYVNSHNLHHIAQSYPGKINHLSQQGNMLVFEYIQNLMDK